MKTMYYSVIITACLLLSFTGCQKDIETDDPPVISGQLTSHSDCKFNKSSVSEWEIPCTQSCVNYSFNAATNKIHMTHVNAGFNCCPDSLYCTTTISKDTIIIRESEKSAGCQCDCLFDLELELTGIELKNYQVRFIEPYSGDQEKILFEMDLTLNNTGSFCVTRTQYPWGE